MMSVQAVRWFFQQSQETDDRVLNSEFGMRNAEEKRGQRTDDRVYRMRKSECGMRKEKKKAEGEISS